MNLLSFGDEKITKVNVRIIAATNKDLAKAAEEGNFRTDLFYRLNAFSIELPPLREHIEDIPDLAHHFLSFYGTKENKPKLHLGNEALKLLQQHPWKGNIRELKNVLERASILADENIILPEHLPYEIQKQSAAYSDNLTLASVEKHHIEKVLQHTRGNKTKAAECLDIGLTTLYRKLEEYHIS